jgi:hypothetical protein
MAKALKIRLLWQTYVRPSQLALVGFESHLTKNEIPPAKLLQLIKYPRLCC